MQRELVSEISCFVSSAEQSVRESIRLRLYNMRKFAMLFRSTLRLIQDIGSC
jgi:hypothetical protein